MKRSLRRAVSLLCVLALCIGLLPSTTLAAGRPGGGGNYGGGGQETQQTVYVYIKIVDSNGQELTGSTVEIDGITYTVNEKGWYTIGTIQLDLPSPSDYNDGNHQTELTSNNANDITQALEDTDRYEANKELISNDDLKDQAQFQSGVNNAQVGLKAAWGANGYSSVQGICWHLDMTVPISALTKYTVTYKDGEANGASFTEKQTTVLAGTAQVGAGLSDEIKSPTWAGYTFTGWKMEDDDSENLYQIGDSYVLTQHTTFVAQWEKNGPDITVTKELTSVVREGQNQAITDDMVLYEGDELTWTITVTNNTESALSFKIADELKLTQGTVEYSEGLTVTDGSPSFNKDSVPVQPGHSKELTARYTVKGEDEGFELTNTATVTYSGKEYPDSTTNNVGYTIKVTYKGNGGMAEDQDTETVTLRKPSLPIDYTVESTAIGFEKAGYTFDGWYTEATGGTQVMGEQSLSSDATYFAHWTENEKTYGAGYFVLVPSAIPGDFNPATGYDPSQYLPYDKETIGSESSAHEVNSTTGYIGFITQDAVTALTDLGGGIQRLEISEDDYADYLVQPQGSELGRIWSEYLDIDSDRIEDNNYKVVWYQINNHTLSASWPNIDQGGHTKAGYHVDGYIEGVDIDVVYAKNDGTDTIYRHSKVDGEPIKSGDTYTVLANTTANGMGFTREGYTFNGWNTQADGSGTTYAAGAQISPLMTGTVLYAQWQKNDGETKTLSYTVEYYKDGVKQENDTQIVNQEVWVNNPDTLTVDKANINTTDKYTGYMFDHTEPATIPGTIENGGVIRVYYVKEDTPDYTVTIWPADITIYTGGEVYGGVTDANGNLISESDDIEASGLPEPGYHLTLSTDVMTWLNEKTGTYGPRDLEDYLTFTYDVGGVIREWELTYVGVYDTNPTRYVYSLEPGKAENGEAIPVRLLFKDESGEVAYDDIIGMAENSVCEEYTMSINPGTLTQSEIKAVFTVPGEDPLTCGIAIQPGTLTIRSTTDEEYVNDIGANADGILADGNVTYYVNDSGVTVDEDRVGLLVDEVSNNAAFNREMAQDAMDHAIDSSATDWTHRSDLSYDMAYLDLVDTDNGHAVVTMGEGDSLTIYWPMPDDADPYGDFHVVHYTGMDRESTVGEEGLSGTAKEILNGEAIRIDGRWYVAFDADSFSPFVLVYEEEDNDRPTRPDPDPDDDKDDEDEEEAPVDDGLNREDHYAYIAGYEDGTVRPDGNITRAEVATIFFRLMTDEYRETCWSTSSGFTDVTAANWYNNAISTTANAGWVSGYPDGTFRPDAYITRAEFATIAARFLSDVYGGTSMFTDITGHWAEDYINRAAAAGWINGYADGTFRPNAYITRAEAVTLINRMLDRAPDANHLLADMVRWPDNPETAWYYADIQEATNSHDYTRAGTGNYEVWTELLANRDWAALEEIWSQANDAPGGEVADGLTPNGN